MRADAARMRIRFLVTPLRVTDFPVVCSCDRTSATVAVGLVCLMIAQAPATCGVAIEVPLKTANPLPGTEELIDEPGAMMSTSAWWFENDDTSSVLVVD